MGDVTKEFVFNANKRYIKDNIKILELNLDNPDSVIKCCVNIINAAIQNKELLEE